MTALLSCLLALAQPARAVDFTWSGFGTLGYAESDENFDYQRFINKSGSFKRDSLIGAQLDARFSQQWGATVQAKLAPSDRYDNRWQPSLAWAFVSWRPSDDWLIRVGKIRLPLMLNTENVDVGSTFDFARLPQEVYSISPMTDVVGLSLSKTWFGETFDWIAEAYYGQANTYWRYYGRNISFNSSSPGSWFLPIDVKSSGLVLTARNIDHTFRIGFHEVEASREGAKTGTQITLRQIAPGVSAYDFAPGGVDQLIIPVYTLSASVLLPGEVRLTGEYARVKVNSATAGLSRWGGYLALSRRWGAWTPYVYYATMKSTDASLGKYRDINNHTLPPPYSALNNSQKFLADIVAPYDQSTVALGTSYRLTSNSLLKAEWSRARTGQVSSFVDAPYNEDSGGRKIDVFSLSYSFTF
jgi:hypothetical protein